MLLLQKLLIENRKVNLYLYLVREDNSPGRIQAAPLSWLNFVTSHSSWEASKTKSPKTNRWIIIVTNYQTWTCKLQFFWYISFWISDFSTFKTDLQNSLLSNINDDGDNNDKPKNLKTQLGIFKNMGGNIPGRNFLGRNFPRGSLTGGNFPGGSFPDTSVAVYGVGVSKIANVCFLSKP